MNEFDEYGWARIHRAAQCGFLKSIGNFVQVEPEQLELETVDATRATPLMIAVLSGNTETVGYLLQLGANVNVLNYQNERNLVELAAMRRDCDMLRFLLHSEHLPDRVSFVPVGTIWQTLIRMLSSPDPQVCENGGVCLRELLDPALCHKHENPQGEKSQDGVCHYWNTVIDAKLIPSLVQVITNTGMTEEAKAHAFFTLLHVIQLDRVREQFISSGGVAALVPLLLSESVQLVKLSAQVLGGMAEGGHSHAKVMVKAGLLPTLLKVLTKWSSAPSTTTTQAPIANEDEKQEKGPTTSTALSAKEAEIEKYELLKDLVTTLGIVCEGNPEHQQAVSEVSHSFQLLSSLYHRCNHVGLLLALTITVQQLVEGQQDNQLGFVETDITSSLISLLNSKNNELHMAVVQCVDAMVLDNHVAQRRFLHHNVTASLLQLLNRTRKGSPLREALGHCLWSLAGTDAEEKRIIAAAIGVPMLVEFIKSGCSPLHHLGCKCLRILVQGAHSLHDSVCEQGGMFFLLALLRAEENEDVVEDALRTLRHLCLGVGYQVREHAQTLLETNSGLPVLAELLTYAAREEIRAEAASALAAACFGNATLFSELRRKLKFTLADIWQLSTSNKDRVRLSALNTLAMLCYNCPTQQREIAQLGGVQLNDIMYFLHSNNLEYKSQAAFLIVLLSRVIPDEEITISCGVGIKMLADLLVSNENCEVWALTADHIARLAHTRLGLLQALCSVGVVDPLCDMLRHEYDFVRGCAATALSFLSPEDDATRHMLTRFRREPSLMTAFQCYDICPQASARFHEGWRHIKKVGFPHSKIEVKKSSVQQPAQQKVPYFPTTKEAEFQMEMDSPTEDLLPSPSSTHKGPTASQRSPSPTDLNEDEGDVYVTRKVQFAEKK